MNKYKECFDYIVSATNGGEGITKQLNIIKELVDKENPKKWDEDYILEQINCPICGKYWNIIDNCTETFRYCPNCGQKLEVGE